MSETYTINKDGLKKCTSVVVAVIANRVALMLALYIIFYYIVAHLAGEFDRDSTDSETARSGMVLHTDNLTGCQYLSVINGGITPRLDNNGNHLGC